VKILVGFLLLLSFLSLTNETHNLSQTIITFILGILSLSYSISCEIKESFKNKKHINLFGISILKFNLDVILPFSQHCISKKQIGVQFRL